MGACEAGVGDGVGDQVGGWVGGCDGGWLVAKNIYFNKALLVDDDCYK